MLTGKRIGMACAILQVVAHAGFLPWHKDKPEPVDDTVDDTVEDEEVDDGTK